jgi:hypothetical protein
MDSTIGLTMDLVAGMRVGMMIDGGETIVALVHSVDGDNLELQLLEGLDGRQVPDAVITLFAPHERGMHHWSALAAGQPLAGRLSLALMGNSWIVQRRLYPRFDVDLPAQIHRVRQGTRTPARSVQIVDLSHGGARAVGAIDLSTGDTVVLDLDVGSGIVTAPGRVAMAYPDGHGRRVNHIAFDAPDAPELAGIDAFLSTLDSKAPANATS